MKSKPYIIHCFFFYLFHTQHYLKMHRIDKNGYCILPEGLTTIDNHTFFNNLIFFLVLLG